jgi:hypothetical protein
MSAADALAILDELEKSPKAGAPSTGALALQHLDEVESNQWKPAQPAPDESSVGMKRFRALTTGVASAVPSILGFPMALAEKVKESGRNFDQELAKHLGKGAPKLGGESARILPEGTLGPSWWAQKLDNAVGSASEKMGLGRPPSMFDNPLPDDSVAQMLHTGGNVAGAALVSPASSARELMKNVAKTLPAAAGAATAEQIAPNSPLAPFIGALTPSLLKQGSAAAIRAALRGKNPEAMQQTIKDFETAGTTPSLAQASGNRFLQATESALAVTPGAAGVMNKRAAGRQDAMSTKLKGMIDDIGNSEAGDAVQRGILGDSGFKARLMEQYDQAAQNFAQTHIKPTDKFQAANSISKIGELTKPIPGAPALSQVKAGELLNHPVINAFLNDASAAGTNKTYGPMPFQSLKEVRTVIGQAMESNDIVGTPLQGKLKQVYGALTNDMRAAAMKLGPKALKDFDAMNENYSRGRDAIDFLQPYIKKGLPADTYQSLAKAGEKDPKALIVLKNSLKPAEWRVFQDAYLSRLGSAKSSAQNAEGMKFSSESFLTNWNHLNPESREILMQGHPAEEALRANSRVASNIREGSKVWANPSGTAGKTALTNAAYSAFAALASGHPEIAASIVAGSGVANLLARALTNPSVVKSVAQKTQFGINPHTAAAARGALLANSLKKKPSDAESSN